MRLAVTLAMLSLGCAATTPAVDENRVLHDASRMTLPVAPLPEPAIVIAQYPTKPNLAYAVLIVMHETAEGVASSLTMEPENDRFAVQLARQRWTPRRLVINQWSFTPSECPAIAPLYTEFANIPELPPPDSLPPHASETSHVVEMYVTKAGAVESLGAPVKYTHWAWRVWKALDACRAGRTPRRR